MEQNVNDNDNHKLHKEPWSILSSGNFTRDANCIIP